MKSSVLTPNRSEFMALLKASRKISNVFRELNRLDIIGPFLKIICPFPVIKIHILVSMENNECSKLLYENVLSTTSVWHRVMAKTDDSISKEIADWQTKSVTKWKLLIWMCRIFQPSIMCVTRSKCKFIARKSAIDQTECDIAVADENLIECLFPFQ